MSGSPGNRLEAAALGGASAMAIFAAAEIGFTELVHWALHRDSFAPLDPGFGAVLFLASLAVGAVLALLIAVGARLVGRSLPPTELGTAIALALQVPFLRARFTGGALFLIVLVVLGLFTTSFAAMIGEPLRERLRFLTDPVTAALLLFAPGWLLDDLLAGASRPVRVASFAGLEGVIVAAAWWSFRHRPRPFTATALRTAAVAAALAMALAAAPDSPRQTETRAGTAPGRGPNVLLVVLDTVRADHLPLYGYARDTAPNLRRFAESATLYTHAIAPSNMTLATHASLFTGLAASQHRAHYDAGHPAGRPLGTGIRTLAEIFVERGYDVSSVAGNYGFLGKGFGLDRGFAYVDARPRRGTLGVLLPGSLRWHLRGLICRMFPGWPLADTRARDAGEITDLAIRRINRAREAGRPYFLFVNYFDAHERVLVPPAFAGQFSTSPERSTGALLDTYLREMGRTGRIDLPPGDREALVARYDETLAYLDDRLGRLLRHAAERDPDERTLVVVTSDHGEAFGEHATIGHGSSSYAEQVSVPLVIRKPRQRQGDVMDGTVGLADLFALLRGDIAELPAGGPVVAEALPLVDTPEKRNLRTGRALFRSGYAFFRSSRDGKVELYATVADPEELRDLAPLPEFADVSSSMSEGLDRWIAAHPPVASPATRESLEDRARLRALGYLQ